MTVNILTQNLIDFGLNDREASIYLYLLSNKDQTVFQVSKALHLPRTTVYSDLERLKGRTLVSIFKKNHIAYWYAEHPRRLVKEAESKSSMIKEIFPELESMMEKNTLHPEVRFYEGKDSIKDIINSFYDILETKTNRNLYTISHPELLENFPKYLPNVLSRKNKLKIYTHLIAPEFVKGLNLPAYSNDEFREVRFLPDKYPFNSTIMIMEDHVALFSLKDEKVYAITISSSTISHMFKQIFLFAWSMAVKG
ncbi:MAG: helix-turn-helix domain-containing protein [Patescibacteria group bacterium]